LCKVFWHRSNGGAYNTLKIGIFGDSYADCSFGGSKDEQRLSWPYRLSQKYNVQNFAKCGSGPERAIELLLRKQRRYDKIIFAFSRVERLYIAPVHKRKLKYPHLEDHIRAWNEPVYKDDPFYMRLYKLAQDHQKHFVAFSEQRIQAYNLLLNNLLGDRLLLLTMKGFIPNTDVPYKVSNELELCAITAYEDDKLWRGERNVDLDRRSCHMTEVHHDMMYDKIQNWIEDGDFSLTRLDLQQLPKNYKERYKGEW